MDSSSQTPSPTANVSWTDYVAPDLASAVRQRGARYFALSRVRLSFWDDNRIQAEVVGTAQNVYEVSLKWRDRDSGTLVAGCNCPHFQRGELCKHVWALCLTAEAHGWPEALDASEPSSLADGTAAEPDVQGNDGDAGNG
ncbi:MAG: SWIM zinc finger family protein, partial [Gammaproteobacteria bacterium]|nr:SWIM zinc finger family protein [Gammaproteobacteria bacterium]